jgi:excisionase family DNA binding protein
MIFHAVVRVNTINTGRGSTMSGQITTRRPEGMISPKPKVEAATVTVEEAGQILGLSRNSAYIAARKGQLPTLRIGKRLVVPRAALDRLLASADSIRDPKVT